MRKVKKKECVYCDRNWEELEDIICNKCGKSCKMYMTSDHKHYNFEGLRASADPGFGSSLDGLRIKFDLCDNCLVGLVKDFKISCVEEDE